MKGVGLDEMLDYVKSCNPHKVTTTPSNVTITSFNTVMEIGYDKYGKVLYNKRLANEELDWIIINIYNDKNQITFYQRLSHLRLVNPVLVAESYSYDDKDRLIYYKIIKGRTKADLKTQWEKYKYVDNKNLSHLTYRNSDKELVKVKMDNDGQLLEYSDGKHNWWSSEFFKNDCPFKIIPLPKNNNNNLEVSI